MKRFLLFLVIIPVFFGCNKISSSGQWDGKSGLYINGQLETKLRSAFAGGGIADPAEGRSHRMHIYEGYYSDGPDWDEIQEKVLIQGFRHTGKTYSGIGEAINSIAIQGLSSIDEIYIPMNQGNYEGGNEMVTSVKIVEYSLAKFDNKGNRIGDGEINIQISLNNNQTISIIYSGPIPYDNYF